MLQVQVGRQLDDLATGPLEQGKGNVMARTLFASVIVTQNLSALCWRFMPDWVSNLHLCYAANDSK
jgi:hypothetical protein